MTKPRIGVLTSGGDCPGLNAVIRGVVLAAEKLGWEVLGFLDGLEGLLPPGNYKSLGRRDTAGIMPRGGTIIGTTNRGHFVAKIGAGEPAEVAEKVIADAREVLEKLGVNGLIIVGGDGSMATAQQLRRAENNRQRPGSNGNDLRFRFCRRDGDGRARSFAYDGYESQTNHGP